MTKSVNKTVGGKFINHPNVIMIEAVGICNAKCSYCPQGLGKIDDIKKEDRFISRETLKKALYIAKKGNQKAIYLHHRGEPLLHPEIGYIISEVRKSGFLAYLSTNLISATEDKITEIVKSGINQVEIHLSGGLTILDQTILLKRIHLFRKANWVYRNNSIKIEVNYGLTKDETEENVRNKLSNSEYYDESMYIRFFYPHDWPALVKMEDKGINPYVCKWYKTNSYAILSNGDIVICCLDQTRSSKIANVNNIDFIKPEYLSKRDICKGCVQYDWDMDWLEEEALNIPEYLKRKLIIDPWKE